MHPGMMMPAVVAWALLAIGAPAAAQSASDSAGVRRAALDYVEGYYEGDTTKLVRSVSPRVYKYGYSRGANGYQGTQMPYARFMSFARGVQQGRNTPPPNAPKRVELLDVLDQTAAARLTAWWGTDYLLMAKENGRWMITHGLWQSPPPR